MPICPHCGQAFKDYIDYYTEEEREQFNITVKKLKRYQLSLKLYVVSIAIFLILLLADSIVFPNVTPYIRGFRAGGCIVSIVVFILHWYYGYKEYKRVSPLLRNAGAEL